MTEKTKRSLFDTDAAGFAQGKPVKTGRNVIVAEFKYDSGLVAEKNQVYGTKQKQLNEFLKICENHAHSVQARIPVSKIARQTRVRHPVADLSKLTRSPGMQCRLGEYVHAGFVEVEAKSGKAEILMKKLRNCSGVWHATPAPAPVPAGRVTNAAEEVTGRSKAARNFEPAQGYLFSAPVGIDINAAWKKPGGKGKGVLVCDIEANWNRWHQDLPGTISISGGKLVRDQQWRNHGTAVLGILAAKPGVSGIRGICPEIEVSLQSGFFSSGFNVSHAITTAAKRMSKGDIMLLEMQAPGPSERYVAMHYWDDVYSALRAAVELGIVTVVAAGNGGLNFDDKSFAPTNLQKDFGGLLVGAGVPVTNYYDIRKEYGTIGIPRSAMPLSNYGKQVNVQAWGWHVATLGYGDVQGGVESRWATLRFAGTSSAAAIVCGAAACLQGIAKASGLGALSAREMRSLIIETGTAQAGKRRIGPQPNLASAVKRLLKEK